MTLFDVIALAVWIAWCLAIGHWTRQPLTPRHIYRSKCNCGWHSSWWRVKGPPTWAWWIHAFVGWLCGDSVDGSVEKK